MEVPAAVAGRAEHPKPLLSHVKTSALALTIAVLKAQAPGRYRAGASR